MNYTKTLPYELDLTSRVLHEVMVSFFKKNNFPITLEEFIILDCLSINPEIIQMQLIGEDDEKKEYEYEATVKLTTGGNYGYTFRVMPKNDMLLDSANMNLIKWITK